MSEERHRTVNFVLETPPLGVKLTPQQKMNPLYAESHPLRPIVDQLVKLNLVEKCGLSYENNHLQRPRLVVVFWLEEYANKAIEKYNLCKIPEIGQISANNLVSSSLYRDYKIFVDNLPFGTEKKELEAHLEGKGKFYKMKVIQKESLIEKNGLDASYAVITCKNYKDAEEVVRKFNNSLFKKKVLHVYLPENYGRNSFKGFDTHSKKVVVATDKQSFISDIKGNEESVPKEENLISSKLRVKKGLVVTSNPFVPEVKEKIETAPHEDIITSIVKEDSGAKSKVDFSAEVIADPVVFAKGEDHYADAKQDLEDADNHKLETAACSPEEKANELPEEIIKNELENIRI